MVKCYPLVGSLLYSGKYISSAYMTFSKHPRHFISFHCYHYIDQFQNRLMAALSSQLYTDVLYLYSDFGNPLKREKTLNRSIEGWASIYATKCLSAATLFGTYEAVRAPASRFVGQLVSGGVAGCAGSKDFDLCMETYLIDNPPSAVMEALSNVDWEDNFAWLLIPFNDLDSFFSSLSNILDRILDMM